MEEVALVRMRADELVAAVFELRKENINQFTLRAVLILLSIAYLGSSLGTFGVIYCACSSLPVLVTVRLFSVGFTYQSCSYISSSLDVWRHRLRAHVRTGIRCV
jgi:hypothetical protein